MKAHRIQKLSELIDDLHKDMSTLDSKQGAIVNEVLSDLVQAKMSLEALLEGNDKQLSFDF